MQLFISVLIYSKNQKTVELGLFTLHNCYVSCFLDGLKLFLKVSFLFQNFLVLTVCVCVLTSSPNLNLILWVLNGVSVNILQVQLLVLSAVHLLYINIYYCTVYCHINFTKGDYSFSWMSRLPYLVCICTGQPVLPA